MGVSLPGGGGKRALDFEINLVPFIDLLSCCIAFLLITAAWNQLARMETTQKADPPGANQPNKERTRVDIQIDLGGFKLMVPGEEAPVDLRKKGAEYDWDGLKKKLDEVRVKFPGVKQSLVAGMDNVQYKDVIRAMDICNVLGLLEMSLGSAEPIGPPGGQ